MEQQQRPLQDFLGPSELPENRDYQLRSDVTKLASVKLDDKGDVKNSGKKAPTEPPENRDSQFRGDKHNASSDKAEEANNEKDRVYR